MLSSYYLAYASSFLLLRRFYMWLVKFIKKSMNTATSRQGFLFNADCIRIPYLYGEIPYLGPTNKPGLGIGFSLCDGQTRPGDRDSNYELVYWLNTTDPITCYSSAKPK